MSSAKHRLVTFQWSGMARRGFLKKGIIDIVGLDNYWEAGGTVLPIAGC